MTTGDILLALEAHKLKNMLLDAMRAMQTMMPDDETLCRDDYIMTREVYAALAARLAYKAMAEVVDGVAIALSSAIAHNTAKKGLDLPDRLDVEKMVPETVYPDVARVWMAGAHVFQGIAAMVTNDNAAMNEAFDLVSATLYGEDAEDGA